jgi:hypothetical protein
MNRRDSLKKIALASGLLVSLPSWANDWSLESLSTSGSVFNIAEQDLLASVTDTIIPQGNAIGALSVGVDKFLLRLLTDCYDAEVQTNVKSQLLQLDAKIQTQFGKSFTEATQGQRQELLLTFSASEIKSEKDFFNLMKSETIRGFNTSREVLMNYLQFKPVPGHFYGCVDVKN